ncbi:MAG: MFS transporter [Dehalococcoidia bacterium]
MKPSSAVPGRIFYGWWVVLGLAAISAVMTAMGSINLGLFIAPMKEELGIGQSMFGLAQTARLIGFSVTGWLIGRYLDRHGARIPIAAASLIVGVTVAGMAFIEAGWQMIVLLLISGMTGLQGQGGNLYTTVPIARWFLRKRGQAFAVAFMGIPVGVFILAPLTQVLIDSIGWRETWLFFGISGTVVCVLIALLVIRRDPAEMGLLPDGDLEPAVRPQGSSIEQVRRERSWTREEAMQSSTFWRLALVDGMRMGSMSTLGLFRIPYYIDNGVSPQAVAFALSFEAAVAAVAGLATGWMVDRFPARFISAGSNVPMILAFLLTIGADSVWQVFLAAGMFGIAAQSFSISQGTLWPSYFGSANIGKIRGIAMPLGLGLSAVSAPLTGLVKDTTGSFIIAWVAACVALTLCTLLLLVTVQPKDRRTDDAASGRTDAETAAVP